MSWRVVTGLMVGILVLSFAMSRGGNFMNRWCIDGNQVELEHCQYDGFVKV
jgi:hypothetical protein